jgi:hypothetical protein
MVNVLQRFLYFFFRKTLVEMPGKYINIEEKTDKVQAEKN